MMLINEAILVVLQYFTNENFLQGRLFSCGMFELLSSPCQNQKYSSQTKKQLGVGYVRFSNLSDLDSVQSMPSEPRGTYAHVVQGLQKEKASWNMKKFLTYWYELLHICRKQKTNLVHKDVWLCCYNFKFHLFYAEVNISLQDRSWDLISNQPYGIIDSPVHLLASFLKALLQKLISNMRTWVFWK